MVCLPSEKQNVFIISKPKDPLSSSATDLEIPGVFAVRFDPQLAFESRRPEH